VVLVPVGALTIETPLPRLLRATEMSAVVAVVLVTEIDWRKRFGVPRTVSTGPLVVGVLVGRVKLAVRLMGAVKVTLPLLTVAPVKLLKA
jgi:hypothetical protein